MEQPAPKPKRHPKARKETKEAKEPATLRFTLALLESLDAELALARAGGNRKGTTLGTVAEALLREALAARGRPVKG